MFGWSVKRFARIGAIGACGASKKKKTKQHARNGCERYIRGCTLCMHALEAKRKKRSTGGMPKGILYAHTRSWHSGVIEKILIGGLAFPSITKASAVYRGLHGPMTSCEDVAFARDAKATVRWIRALLFHVLRRGHGQLESHPRLRKRKLYLIAQEYPLPSPD